MQEGLRKAVTIPLYVIGFILLGLVSGYLAFKVLSFSKTVDVPDLRDKTLVEANTLLTKRGLYLKVEGEDFDPLIVPGRIVRQDVPAGNKVKEQRGIKVFLSKGPKVWSIPELTGQIIEEAEPVIGKSGLRIEKVIHVHSDTVEKDRIIAQRPNPDEVAWGPLSENSEENRGRQYGLSLIVSSGPYEALYSCPDFSGKSREEALALAERLHLNLQLGGSGERVKSQRPKPHAVIRSGEPVYLQFEGEEIMR
ncbi:MAG TPA: PASTA domain-containing protein [Thermodesulfovibrionales bacterium]|nr:PASTA domain-containing protein [Thermodesulfovibrionales bacterium]